MLPSARGLAWALLLEALCLRTVPWGVCVWVWVPSVLFSVLSLFPLLDYRCWSLIPPCLPVLSYHLALHRTHIQYFEDLFRSLSLYVQINSSDCCAIAIKRSELFYLLRIAKSSVGAPFNSLSVTTDNVITRGVAVKFQIISRHNNRVKSRYYLRWHQNPNRKIGLRAVVVSKD